MKYQSVTFKIIFTIQTLTLAFPAIADSLTQNSQVFETTQIPPNQPNTYFHNSLLSPALVSPAQYYQVKNGGTELSLGVYQLQRTQKQLNQVHEIESDQNGSTMDVLGVYHGNDDWRWLSAMMGARFEQYSFEEKTNAVDSTKYAQTSMAARPGLLIQVNKMLTMAGTYTFNVIERTNRLSSKPIIDFTYGQPELAGLVHGNYWETGFIWDPRVHKKTDAMEWNSPSALLAHGRIAVTKTINLALALQEKFWKNVDEDLYSNQTLGSFGLEKKVARANLYTNVKYQGAYYKDKTVIAPDLIGIYLLNGGTDIALSPSSSFNVNFDYTFGQRTADDVKIARNGFGAQIGGSLSL